MKRFFIFLIFSCSSPVWAGSVLHEEVTFSVFWPTSLGTSVYVVGSSPELGEWDPVKATRLQFVGGDIWEGHVAIPTDSSVEYKFIAREDGKGTHCDGGNVVWSPGSNLVVNTGASPAAPYTGKTIFYYTSWTNPFFWEVVSTGVIVHAMTSDGPGRSAGESLYRVDGVGAPGRPIEFVFHDGGSDFDNAPYPGFGVSNYYTSLDVFLVQDGDVFNYLPHPSPSGSMMETGFVNSTAAGIPGRDVRIYLPRGYNEHTNRFYPVMYMHDGQNVFTPGGAFGSWDADLTADKEISQGRMRECIIVGIDNNANRLNEYLPPSQSINPGVFGIGDKYVDFIEDNVRPFINSAYRTQTDKSQTFCMGSSLGGLISLYMGVERTGWGRIGVMSPAYWSTQSYYENFGTNDVTVIDRVYLDWGTEEGTPGNDSNWDSWQNIHFACMEDGFAQHGHYLHVVGCGDGHNEPAWAKRLPESFRFLMNIQEEANELAVTEVGPSLSLDISLTPSNTVALTYTTLAGVEHTLMSGNAVTNFPAVEAQFTEPDHPWNLRMYEDNPGPAEDRRYYRLESTP